MTRYLAAFREAWWTFRLYLLGWRVETYTLPVWPGYGRCTGSLFRCEPLSPNTMRDEGDSGWSLNSHGESYPERWLTPLDAVQPNPRMTIIARRAARVRETP